MNKPLLEFCGVVAGYGNGDILRDITLTVPEGGVISIIGPNGHGKSTLLRTVSGLIRPRQGTVAFAGQNLAPLRIEDIVALGIAHIPQGDMIFAEMSIRDNLLMGAHLPAARTRSAETLDEVLDIFPRLRERENQLASTLSGGERRMLGIGRGLMLRARILLIDEPSLGLSPLVTDQIYQVIHTLKAKGQTILLVEENASRTIGLADRVYLLDHGEFVWQGRSDELDTNSDILTTYFGG